jgi:DNA repair exonuclease SbcCD nuclease subunit
MKVAIINDTHCGIRNSSDIFLDNAEKFYTDVFFPTLLERGIRHIIHLGDYFDHRKFINFRALNRNRHVFLERLRQEQITMDIIAGNHDTYYKNTNDLNSLKELLGHYMNEVHIIHEPTVMEYGSLKMGMIPWICSENYEKSMEFIKNAKCDWIGGHFEFAGFNVMRGVVAPHGLDHKLLSRFERVLSGHFHTKSQQDNVTYLGTQMEFFWSDANDPKFFHILDTETRELEAIRNPYTLFQKIVYNDEETDYNKYNVTDLDGKYVKVVVVNKKDIFTFDRFIDRIQNRKIHDLKIAENFDEFVGNNVEDESVSIEDTTELLDTYIDAVETDLDKDRLKVSMRNLMTEAQAIETV